MDELRSYSERHGRGPNVEPLDERRLAKLVGNIYDTFDAKDFWQKGFGKRCPDGDSYGEVGSDPDAYFLRRIGRDGVWPPNGFLVSWDQDTTLDIVEVLHELVAAPLDGHYHGYGRCGMHYSTFDVDAGRAEFRGELNRVLSRLDPPLELRPNGRIVERTPEGFEALVDAAVPSAFDRDPITARIEAARRAFVDRHATPDDRRHAVRDLADVLEHVRGDVKVHMLKKDEAALFQIANGFAIRHNDPAQQREYDDEVWLRWMFYVYLATIHAVLRIAART